MIVAVVQTTGPAQPGPVINVIVADPSDPAPDGCVLIAVPDGTGVDSTYTWSGSAFVASTDSGS
jgi:hypothetical protein